MNKKIIHTVFEHIASLHPDLIAVHQASEEISYRSLDELSNRIFDALAKLGVQKEVVVGTLMPSGIPLIGGLLGIFKSGGIYLPLQLSTPVKKLARILEQCAPSVFIIRESDYSQVLSVLEQTGYAWEYLLSIDSDFSLRVINKTADGTAEKELTTTSVRPVLVSEAEDGNYIFYTSGSTGEPKAILGKHESLGHFIHWELTQFGIDHSCRVSQLAPITFDASLRDIFVPLCSGGTLFIPTEEERSHGASLIAWLEKNQINLVHTVPSVIRLFNKTFSGFEGDAPRLAALQYLMLSGESLYEKDVVLWRSYVGEHATLVNLYGATETTMIKTFHEIGAIKEASSDRIPVGKPMTHTVVAVVNDNIECETGEIGEVYIKSPFFTKGYFLDPELNQQVFIPNPLTGDANDLVYKTGDLGRTLANGNLEILGRTDHMVKVNGVRIELNNVEQAMLSLEGVSQCVVLLHTDKDMESSLVCYYTGQAMKSENVQAQLAAYLEPTAIPNWIKHMDKLPLNMNGKVDRKSLSMIELFFNDDIYKAPEGDIEKKLEEIWKEVLNLSKVSRDVSFFSIGGTSLKAIQLISRIFKELNTLIKVADIFSSPTIEQLAKKIDHADRIAYSKITPIENQEFYEVSFAQRRLWILDQLEENQTAYNMPNAYRIKGELKPDIFQKALFEIIERHEILRTTFVNIEGNPKQKIHDKIDYEKTICFMDIREEEHKNGFLKKLIQEDLNNPFNLERGPLIRTFLVRLDEEEFVFLLNMHHIISDGWTVELLKYEVFTMYEGLLNDAKNILPPLQIQYKDFAHWEKQQLQGNQLNEHRKFWLNYLGANFPKLDIQNRKHQPDKVTYKGEYVEFQIAPDLTTELKRIAKENSATNFMLLLTLTNIILYRLSGQDDLVIGMPSANREHKDLENQAGFYVNTLIVRTQFDSSISFKELLKIVKENMVGIYTHSIYPLDLLMEDLKIDQRNGRNNLFDVIVQIQDTKGSLKESAAINNFEFEKLNLDRSTSKFDFTFNYLLEDGPLTIGIEYNSELYDLQFVQEIKRNIISLVENLITKENLTIQEYKNLLLNEQHLLQLEEQQKEASSELSNEY